MQPGVIIRFLGSCNGNFYIWNPSIQDYKFLPNPEISPHCSRYAYGIGFYSLSNDYNIVVVIYLQFLLLDSVNCISSEHLKRFKKFFC